MSPKRKYYGAYMGTDDKQISTVLHLRRRSCV